MIFELKTKIPVISIHNFPEDSYNIRTGFTADKVEVIKDQKIIDSFVERAEKKFKGDYTGHMFFNIGDDIYELIFTDNFTKPFLRKYVNVKYKYMNTVFK